MKLLTISVALIALAASAFAAKKLELKDLSAVAQKTINENLKGGTIKSINKEKENGVMQYEVETTLGGKARNMNVDVTGKLLVVEEEVSIDSVPAAVKAAVTKAVGTGKLEMVETFQKPGAELMYEAVFATKGGKKKEMVFKADGSISK